MAAAVYRYRFTGPPASFFQRQTAGAVPVSSGAGTADVVDISADTAQLIDLNEAMRSIGFSLIATNPTTSLVATFSPLLGNVCTVDAVNGNNATATRGGLPFLTISAAIVAALAGDTVSVLPGTYTEAVVAKAGVSIVGIDREKCIIDQTGIGVATDILTMSTNLRVANFTIQGSTAAAVRLRGVAYTVAGSEATGALQNCRINVSHTGAGTCVGIAFAGGGSPTADHATVEGCEVLADGSGAQIRRGLLLATAATNPRVRNTNVLVTRTGAAVGTYYAAETNLAGVTLTLQGGWFEGPAGVGGADVSQTLGTLALDGAILKTSNANNLGFTALSGTFTEWFGDTSALPNSVTRFFRHGNVTVQVTELVSTVRAPRVARAIIVRAVTAPGGALVDTFTLRKNGATPAVPLTTNLTGAATSNFNEAVSTGYVIGDTFSVQTILAASATADVEVGIEWYAGG